jgi:carboxyl-terminal processing protease
VLVSGVASDGPAAAAGLRTGWRIVSLGSTPLADLLRPIFEHTSERQWPVEAWRVVETRLRGRVGSKAELTFEDGAGKAVTLAIERRPERGDPVTLGHLPTMHVRVEREKRATPRGATAGIVGFNVWMASVDAQFQKAVDEFRTADGIIVDLRGNPGGLAAMIMGVAGHFVADRKVLGVMKTRQIPEMRFAANPRLVSGDGRAVDVYGGPVALLVDAMSGSASECFAGGMQSIGRVRVFGQTTMGQALPAQVHQLPNGDAMIYAFGDFVTADGTRLEGRGVIPDDVVPLMREDLLAGRDRTLESALAWIDAARRPNPQHP